MEHLNCRALLFLALAMTACPLAAQKGPLLPKDLPPYGPLEPFRAPHVKIKNLKNGLTLWLVERPGFPKVALALAARGGMAADRKDLPGLSELILATIDQGTTSRSAKQIAEEIQAAGGDLSGNARADALLITTEVLATRTDAALSLLADVLEHATFPEDEVALAKRNAADSLRAREAQPDFLATRAMARAIFGEHPYAVVAATEDSISKTEARDLRGEYARRFRSDQALLVAVGDFDSDGLAAMVEKHLGSWAVPRESAVMSLERPIQAAAHAVFFVPRPNSVQTNFAIGAFGPRRSDADYAATEVANAIYGGMFGSRLINNIREDKGYTYSPGAFLQTRREAGLVQTTVAMRNEVTSATLNEINYELNRMATTSPTAEELARAERYLVGVKAISLQSQASVATQLATLWTYGLPPEELGAESERIQKVTAKDVEAVGRKYFPASRQTVVAVGEEKVIQDQLGLFGLEIEKAM